MKEVLRIAEGPTALRGVRTTLLVERLVMWSGEVLLEGWYVGMMASVASSPLSSAVDVAGFLARSTGSRNNDLLERKIGRSAMRLQRGM